MKKFFRLCSCELKKIMKKTSTKVMIILIFIAILASVGMANASNKVMSTNSDENIDQDTWQIAVKAEIGTLNSEIEQGADSSTGEKLTQNQINEAKDRIKINEYRLENNMVPFTSETDNKKISRYVYEYIMRNFVMLIIAVMTIIIAGSCISSEISNGTIKFWLFTPNKRWKILLSKLCVNTAILLVAIVVSTFIGSIVGNIFFGQGQDYLYVSSGVVHKINYILYPILFNLIKGFEIWVYLLFAMMLSVMTRNSAISIGISLALYLGAGTITSIFNLFVKSDWTKFIPFNNFDLANRIFSNDNLYVLSSLSNGNQISISFSFAVLGICCILMLFGMFNNFRRRDIK